MDNRHLDHAIEDLKKELHRQSKDIESLEAIVQDLRFKVHALNERLKDTESHGRQKQSPIFGFGDHQSD